MITSTKQATVMVSRFEGVIKSFQHNKLSTWRVWYILDAADSIDNEKELSNTEQQAKEGVGLFTDLGGQRKDRISNSNLITFFK